MTGPEGSGGRQPRASRIAAVLAVLALVALVLPLVVRWRANVAAERGATGRPRTAAPAGASAPATRSVYQNSALGWSFAWPDSWATRVRAVTPRPPRPPRPGEPRWREAVEFTYAPLDTATLPQVLLRLSVYDDTVWIRLSTAEGPPVGDAVAVGRHFIYVASLPQSNPFAPGSPDAAQFDRMTMTVDGVRQALTLAAAPAGR